jgi:cytidylate kinase
VRVIAIDGPAGAGKSTVAAALAQRLGMARLDTGAMYRAVAFAALRDGIDPGDAARLGALARGLDLEVGERVMVDGVDATAAIRGPEVTATVSAVSVHPEVRAELVRRQREWAEAHQGGVVEGRDIGSVVFPQAELKVFLTAAETERARRRVVQDDFDGDHAAVASDLARRDSIDSTRPASPLAVAQGALVMDTTGRSVDDVVEEVMEVLARP